MTTDENPYSSLPEATPPEGGGAVVASPAAVRHLVSIGFWMRIFAGFFFACAGCSGCGSVVGLVAPTEAADPVAGFALTGVYLVVMAFYAVPGAALWWVASAASDLKVAAASGDVAAPSHLETALERMLRFWRVLGMLVLAFIGLYALAIGGAIAFGVMRGFGAP